MNRARPLFFMVAFFAGTALGITAGREIGPSLTYQRLDDILSAPAPDSRLDGAVVLDARYAAAPAPATGWPAPLRPTLVLLGPASPAWLIEALNPRPAHVLTLSATAAQIPSDLQVETSLEADHAAYHLLAEPTEEQWSILLGHNLAKRRFDEAALVRARHGESPAPRAAASSSADPTPADTTTEAPAVEIAPDLVLQRAVQVVQGLQALGRF